nr:MAG TPA: hypothetical protein [Caudoviricetes sp.]
MEQWKINAKYVRECAVSLSEFAQACRVFAMTAKHFNDIVIKIKHEQYSNERRAARHQGAHRRNGKRGIRGVHAGTCRMGANAGRHGRIRR